MYVVIMAGGKGTRFWPRSRAATPKQLLDIIGSKTMIQQTVERVATLVPPERILIVTGQEHAVALKRQLSEIPDANIIVEPIGKNTAPCICLAALKIRQKDPESVMAVLPADHYIGDPVTFCSCLKAAIEAATLQDALVTIGIRPNRPETGYGYIQFHDEVACYNGMSVYRVSGFHEKPALEKAQTFLQQGNFLWNSGIFVWKVSAILREIKKFIPDVYHSFIKADLFGDTQAAEKTIATAYETVESISIDYGVMEKAENVLTLQGDFGWNDIGSWSAIYETAKKDKDGNALRGDVIAIDSENILVYSPQKLTAVIGIKNIIIVETADALLVCAKEKSQDVKKAVDILQKNGRKEYL